MRSPSVSESRNQGAFMLASYNNPRSYTSVGRLRLPKNYIIMKLKRLDSLFYVQIFSFYYCSLFHFFTSFAVKLYGLLSKIFRVLLIRGSTFRAIKRSFLAQKSHHVFNSFRFFDGSFTSYSSNFQKVHGLCIIEYYILKNYYCTIL